MKFVKSIFSVGEEIQKIKEGLAFKEAYDEERLTEEELAAFENGSILKVIDEDKAKAHIAKLEAQQQKELKAFDQVLHKTSVGKKVFVLKQGGKVGEDEYGNDIYDGKDLEVCTTDSPSIIGIDGTMLVLSIQNLKRKDVKAIQNLWKTVYQRGKARALEGKPNDYYLTLDIVTIEEHRKLQFTFGCYKTPLFCSSDGDEDLKLMYFTEECFIDISPFNKAEAEYQAAKMMEEGVAFNKHRQKAEEAEAPEKQEVLNDVLFHPELPNGEEDNNKGKYN